MSDIDINAAFDEFKNKLVRLVNDTIDERLEPFRSVLLKQVGGPALGPGTMGDALQVAELLGYDISTAAKQKLAKQKIYYLARTKAIPSVRVSARRLRFDIDKVKSLIVAGGIIEATREEGVILSSSLQQ